ncbi:hypothetical protein F511_27604 [Dorcoceras hygrometricum]|uniref:Retrotransposon Copia-like N-terminal domain-containing protein n=1 Tax=Dorcoceras hygrometricum TaxID=472368 RepID=A0A2Z7AIL7_9LAMI|nr:hypothetical protein F511_27604 [Dorcoceras hygrometricum]
MPTKSTVSGDTTPEKLSSVSIAPLFRSDMSSLQITTHLLNGRNYLQWAQSVKIVVCARGKLGYLTSDLIFIVPNCQRFQDHLSGKKIGSAKLHDGLYDLESSSSDSPRSSLACVQPKSGISLEKSI